MRARESVQACVCFEVWFENNVVVSKELVCSLFTIAGFVTVDFHPISLSLARLVLLHVGPCFVRILLVTSLPLKETRSEKGALDVAER